MEPPAGGGVTDSAWDRFGAKLATVFPALLPGDTLIFSLGRRYVQLAQYERCVHTEAVSDEFLPPEQRLTAEQKTKLRELGWHPPDRDSYRNYWHESDVPLSGADSRRLATLFVRTLRDVHGVESPEALETEAWNDTSGQPLEVTW